MNLTPISAAPVSVRNGIGHLRLRGLASGTLWTLAASVTAAVSQWLLLMVTAKLGSPEMVGHLALSFAVVAPMQVLADLALRPALATDTRGVFRFRDYAELRGMAILLMVAAVGVAALYRGGAAGSILAAVGLQKAVESASDLWFGVFQREERFNWMGQSVVLRSAASSTVFVAAMLAYGDLLVACLAGLIVRMAVFLLLDSGRGLTLVSLNDKGERRLGHLIRTSLPLAGGLFLMSFAVNIPRYFVEKRLGVAALGVFAALVYVFQAGAMLVDAVAQASCVRLARHHMRGDSGAFRQLVGKLAALAVALAGLGLALAFVGGGPLLRLIYSAAFAVQGKPFLWLGVCSVPWYCSSVLGYALVARRQMTALFYCQVVSLVAALAGSYWLIGEASLAGACVVVFLTYGVLLALYTFVLWRVPPEGKSEMTDYTTAFYEKQSDGSARSAARMVPLLLDLVPGIQSVVDVGCGVGTFLEEFRNRGIGLIRGFDGGYVNRDLLRIGQDEFSPQDLSEPFTAGRRFDLAISLEVAEHLPPGRGSSFVVDLTRLSDAILFSAAIPGQGGTLHVNERWQDYWAGQFQGCGYYAIDAIRSQIWDLDEVEPWYRQNTILYVNLAALERNPKLLSYRASSLPSLRVVHPATWLAAPGPKELLRTVGDAIPLYFRKAGELLRGRL